jgi:hypothetical protein
MLIQVYSSIALLHNMQNNTQGPKVYFLTHKYLVAI